MTNSKLLIYLRGILLSMLVLISCQPKKAQVKETEPKLRHSQNDITYEIFIQSFADSNGDGIGDIPGMTSKLDYLQELGIEAIWLMPIHESPSYHKYDVVDYKSIHPDYGTTEDFKTFLAEAHKKGMKVIIDFIINHTSDHHPWFLESKKGKNNSYRNYYIWEKEEVIRDEIEKTELSHDSGNLTQWHKSQGNDELYYGFFTGAMPDLNYDNPKVFDEIVEIGRYWLEDIGVDGLRMDAAKHIFDDSRAEDNHKFWVKFKEAMEAIKPDVYIVGEVWADAETVAPFSKGLSSLFNFDLAFSIEQTLKSGVVSSTSISGHSYTLSEDSSFVKTLIQNQKAFGKKNPQFTDAIFLSNHDQNRVASVLENRKNRIKQAAAILLTLPGRPYLYYGEELGMLGMKPDENIREPFLWDIKENDVSRTGWLVPRYTADSTVESMEVQKSKTTSILNVYKALIDVRKKSSALYQGNLVDLNVSSKQIIGYVRSTSDETVVILHNISREKTSMQLPGQYSDFKQVLYKNRAKASKDGLIELSPNGSIILQKE